jgi:hypothetical protein
MYHAFQKVRRKNFECLHDKEMINVSWHKNVYPDLNIIQNVDASKHMTLFK